MLDDSYRHAKATGLRTDRTQLARSQLRTELAGSVDDIHSLGRSIGALGDIADDTRR